MPVEAGQHALRLRGTAQKGLDGGKGAAGDRRRHRGNSLPGGRDGRSDQVGGETTYEVHVVNQGSKAAGNVR